MNNKKRSIFTPKQATIIITGAGPFSHENQCTVVMVTKYSQQITTLNSTGHYYEI